MTDVFTLTRCTECELSLTGCACQPIIVRVDYPGSFGTFMEPPEPADVVIWCPVCQEQTDVVADPNLTSAVCLGGPGKPQHDVTLPDNRP
jgi:hypothetical protein